MKLLIMLFYPNLLLPLFRSKYSRHLFVLEHPESTVSTLDERPSLLPIQNLKDTLREYVSRLVVTLP
jgi:hypothetical protein